MKMILNNEVDSCESWTSADVKFELVQIIRKQDKHVMLGVQIWEHLSSYTSCGGNSSEIVDPLLNSLLIVEEEKLNMGWGGDLDF